ncbi:MAG: guanylate kinase [Rickettsiales bacterium]|nr:guanylate kinase [Rickettsiales bacterium]
MQIERKGLLLILSSPSGAGKTTISRKLLENDSEIFMSVSATTRTMRANEVDGKDYYFVSKEKFAEMVENDEFLEYAEVFGNSYGTPKKPVFDRLKNGKDVLFDIDWQGTITLQEECEEDVVSIFILPPSMEELERRLRSRGLDDENVIRNRMSKAANEISHWEIYDYVIVNDDADRTAELVKNILDAERNRRFRLTGLEVYVKGLVGEK